MSGPTRRWWRMKRTWAVAAVGLYLLLVSPLCWGLPVYWEGRSRWQVPPAAHRLLMLTSLPAEMASATWNDGRVACVGAVRDLAEEHNRRDGSPTP